MSKLKQYFNNLKAMRITAIIMTVLWLIAVMATPTPQPQIKEVVKEVPKVEIKEVVKEVSVVKTPQSCKTVIDIDNDIFIVIGNNIASLQFDKMTKYVEEKTPARTEAVINCLADR